MSDKTKHKLQPNSRHCFVCGLENLFGLQLRFFETGPGEVTAEYTVPEHFQGYPGVVHGGIVTAMLDEVSGRAQMNDEQTRFMYTAKLEIRFRKNVPVGAPLRVVGQVEKSKSRMASSTSARRNSPADSGNGWLSPGPSRATRRSFSTMSRPRGLILSGPT